MDYEMIERMDSRFNEIYNIIIRKYPKKFENYDEFKNFIQKYRNPDS
jgi:hypothetical protein